MPASTASRSKQWAFLAGFLAITFLVAGGSSALSVGDIPTWYAGLNKPSFNPPNWIFGPVWTLLYALMAVAAWLIWRCPASQLRSRGLLFFWIQLALNFFWSPIFFRWHRIGGGLVEILLLWLAITATMALFFRLNKAAGWMLVPYFAWVSFASLLNFAIWRLN